ncbi:MAG TPA: tyrosine-type recombinase/integrase [Solirubrobacteraceae bacterium]
MLERYFIRPETVDRIRACWLGDAIQTYVAWLTEQSYSSRCVIRRVPLFMRFGAFAHKRGATHIEELQGHLDAFVRTCLRRRATPCGSKVAQRGYLRDVRKPIEQFLRVVQADHLPSQPAASPFEDWAPRFFEHLRTERGLSPTTVTAYSVQLARFEQYVVARRLTADALTPAVLDGFLAERRVHVCARSLGSTCAALRAFLRYLFREGTVRRDLSLTVDGPRTYHLSEIPRAITAADIEHTLAAVERRSIVGRRDYAMLMLLVVYGLRAREVAALTLDDIDWRASVLHVRGRKAGHAAAYPLVPEVGEALLDYLRNGRPETTDRRIFFHITAPRTAITHTVVSYRAKVYLRRAGIRVSRPGSHTLRHSCAQRLVDAEFSLKVIGDFLGHRHAASTRIYSKVAIEALREVALGDGEAIL